MKKLFARAAVLAVAFASLFGGPAAADDPVVHLETSRGDIRIELFSDRAPKTVENFLAYIRDGFYEGTIFHRVIPDFMVQGGGYTTDYERKSTRAPIENEADNGLRNRRGTVAMARTSEPDSATSQFFINVANNGFLDHTAKTQRSWGYTVFGEVISGLSVVDEISNVRTGAVGPFPKDAPREPIIIERATIE